MTSLPANIYSVAAVREFDRAAIEDFGIPGYTLMTRAGTAAVQAIMRAFPDARRWLVICGAGNNGGDGYVVARLAGDAGIAVKVITLVDPGTLSGDAATAFADFKEQGGVAVGWDGTLDEESELIVDAILGSGLERPVTGEFANAVAAINRHPGKVVALDIPTGIHGDSGNVLGCAVDADLTITFVGLKSGLFLGDAPDYRGALAYDGLEIPDRARQMAPAFYRADDAWLRQRLLSRRRTAHKGNFGHVLVVGGGAGMPGAARLCGEAALRVGAGRVSLATDPAHSALIAATRPELMSHPVRNARDLEPLLAKADVIAFGPGLGQTEWARELFARLSADDRPAVWDADALNLLATSPGSAGNRIITPHPGEAATLSGATTAAVQQDRPAAAAGLAAKYGGIAVLKGASTLIAAEAREPWLCTAGNPGMAAPGMGDVLTGIIAGLLAQGLTLQDAAVAGVEVHARAGDRAAIPGERGMLASELMAELRGIINP